MDLKNPNGSLMRIDPRPTALQTHTVSISHWLLTKQPLYLQVHSVPALRPRGWVHQIRWNQSYCPWNEWFPNQAEVFSHVLPGVEWPVLVAGGPRCSSVVRAFAHGAMGRRIDHSWGGPIELCGKSVHSLCDGSSDRSFMGWTHWLV